jgi:hypothetical protein
MFVKGDQNQFFASSQTIYEVFVRYQNFLLDTSPEAFLTFHNSRKVRRNLDSIILT